MIEVRDISKSYDKLQVLRQVSIDIPRGEIVAVVGPSGAGKTTLLQIIGTLERPDSGTVKIDGCDVTRLGERRLAAFRNARIGFIFQFHQLLPEFTMLENVMMPALIGGQSRGESMRRAMELIEYLGLADRASHKPSELSGGERQRAAVARALVNSPAVVLADEPTGSLDSHNRNDMHRLFLDLNRDKGQTFVIVTHDESLTAGAHRVIHLRDGMVEHIGSSMQ